MNKFWFHKIVRIAQLAMLWFVVGCGQSSLTEIHQLAAQEAKALLANNRGNPDFVILDVRTPKEFKQGHIGGAVMLDYHSPHYIKGLQKLDKSKTYFIYCRTGNRSSRTLKMVKKMGFSKIYHLKLGITDWQSQKLPIVTLGS